MPPRLPVPAGLNNRWDEGRFFKVFHQVLVGSHILGPLRLTESTHHCHLTAIPLLEQSDLSGSAWSPGRRRAAVKLQHTIFQCLQLQLMTYMLMMHCCSRRRCSTKPEDRGSLWCGEKHPCISQAQSSQMHKTSSSRRPPHCGETCVDLPMERHPRYLYLC